MREPYTIGEVMTPAPFAVAADAPLRSARKIMLRERIHHLPVVERGYPIGLLTDRDEVEGREDPREREPLEEDRAVDWEPRELPDEPLLCADARSVASRKARTRTGRKTIRRVRMGISG